MFIKFALSVPHRKTAFFKVPGRANGIFTTGLQGYLAHKKAPNPWDYHRALGIGLLYGPQEALFLMREILL